MNYDYGSMTIRELMAARKKVKKQIEYLTEYVKTHSSVVVKIGAIKLDVPIEFLLHELKGNTLPGINCELYNSAFDSAFDKDGELIYPWRLK